MTKRTTRPTGRDAIDEIDLRLGGLLGDLGQAVGEMLSRLDAGEGGEILRSGEIQTGRGPIRAEAGIRVRVGGQDVGSAGTEPRARPAREDRRPPAAKAPAPRTARSIDADILTGDGLWTLTADLPGVTQDGLDVTVDDGELVVRGEGRGRLWEGRFDLPPGTSRPDLDVHLKNGVLEISVKGQDR